jgi:hypothetical protein
MDVLRFALLVLVVLAVLWLIGVQFDVTVR